jgi:hypothetical protein
MKCNRQSQEDETCRPQVGQRLELPVAQLGDQPERADPEHRQSDHESRCEAECHRPFHRHPFVCMSLRSRRVRVSSRSVSGGRSSVSGGERERFASIASPSPQPSPRIQIPPKTLHIWRGEGADFRFLSEVCARTFWPGSYEKVKSRARARVKPGRAARYGGGNARP